MLEEAPNFRQEMESALRQMRELVHQIELLAKDVKYWREETLGRLDMAYKGTIIIVALIGIIVPILLTQHVRSQVEQASKVTDVARLIIERTEKDADRLLNDLRKKKEQYDVALRELVREETKKATRFGELMSKARVEAEKDNFAAALRRYRQALEIDKQSPQAWVGVGATLGMLGRYEEAQVAHGSAIKLDPNYAIAWYNKGVALWRLGRHEKALDAFENTIKLDPKDAPAWTNSGVILTKLDRNREALESHKKALELAPNYALAWFNKAGAHSLLGEKSEMLVALKRAIELDPKRKEKAKTDPDFEPYRDDPDFRALVFGEEQ